jgi:Ca-activated chloride channel family protein
VTIQHPWLLFAAAPALAVCILGTLAGYEAFSRRRRLVSLIIRCVMLAAIILGIAGLQISSDDNRQAAVIVADTSASVSSRSGWMTNTLRRIDAERPRPDGLGVVSAAGTSQVVSPFVSSGELQKIVTGPVPAKTDLAKGLLLASALLPGQDRRRIVVMTDGRANAGNTLTAARLIHRLGVRVDVWPVKTSAPEMAIDSVSAPPFVRSHEAFSVTVSVWSNTAGTYRLVLRDAGRIVNRVRRRVQPGENTVVLPEHALPHGLHTFMARLSSRRDTESENNSGSAATRVAGPPHVLVIAPSRHEAADVLHGLAKTHMRPTFKPAASVQSGLADLRAYDATVLVNTPASALGTKTVDAFVPYVRDLGRGLVVIGGPRSYSEGGYTGTALERALPVKMELPKRRRFRSVAVVFIIENLETYRSVNISKEAAKEAIAYLEPSDLVAVNDAQGKGHFAVPLQRAYNKFKMGRAIDNMVPGDPQSYAPDLKASFRVLQRAQAETKHIILVGDGDAVRDYRKLVTHIRAAGITVSTVATGGGRCPASNNPCRDPGLMRNIARWGGGRYYDGRQADRIPRIILREAKNTDRLGIVRTSFYPKVVSSSPMLKGIHKLAPLTGYVATTPKTAGGTVMKSGRGDPLLAGWQYGLGRAVAWTSDAAGLWTRQWVRSGFTAKFWGNLVAWSLPSRRNDPLPVSVVRHGATATATVRAPDAHGLAPVVSLRVVSPDGHTAAVPAARTGSDTFSASFPAQRQGTYEVSARAQGGGPLRSGTAELEVSYAPEFQRVGVDLPFDRALARAGGGQLIKHADAVWADNLAAVSVSSSLAAPLWVLALLLFPVDIAVRRLVVNRDDWRRLLGRPTPPPQPE